MEKAVWEKSTVVQCILDNVLRGGQELDHKKHQHSRTSKTDGCFFSDQNAKDET